MARFKKTGIGRCWARPRSHKSRQRVKILTFSAREVSEETTLISLPLKYSYPVGFIVIGAEPRLRDNRSERADSQACPEPCRRDARKARTLFNCTATRTFA